MVVKQSDNQEILWWHKKMSASIELRDEPIEHLSVCMYGEPLKINRVSVSGIIAKSEQTSKLQLKESHGICAA